jgi:hypothetical protein
LGYAINGYKKQEEQNSKAQSTMKEQSKTHLDEEVMKESKPAEKLAKEIYIEGNVEGQMSDTDYGRDRAASFIAKVKAGFKF